MTISEIRMRHTLEGTFRRMRQDMKVAPASSGGSKDG